VVDIVDEQRLCELALAATASQLARMISGFRSADGMRMPQQTNTGCCGMSERMPRGGSGRACHDVPLDASSDDGGASITWQRSRTGGSR
jgi:hypothetical protein